MWQYAFIFVGEEILEHSLEDCRANVQQPEMIALSSVVYDVKDREKMND